MYNTSWIDVYGTHPWLENFAKIIKSFFELTGGGGGGLVSHYLKKKSSLRGKILIVQFQKISLLLPSPIHKTVGIYWGWRVLLDQNFERNASSLIGISRGVGSLGKKIPYWEVWIFSGNTHYTDHEKTIPTYFTLWKI